MRGPKAGRGATIATMSISISTSPEDSHAVIAIHGSFTRPQYRELGAAIEVVSVGMRRMTIDMTRMESLEVAALGPLLQARGKSKSAVLVLRVRDDSAVKRTLDAANFCRLFVCEVV